MGSKPARTHPEQLDHHRLAVADQGRRLDLSRNREVFTEYSQTDLIPSSGFGWGKGRCADRTGDAARAVDQDEIDQRMTT